MPDDKQNFSIPSRSYLAPNGNATTTSSRDAAAAIMRQQIDTLYDDTSSTTAQPPQTATVATADDPYDRSHDNRQSHAATSTDWQHYHSAWQTYYQQYYDRYYRSQHEKISTELKKERDARAAAQKQAADAITHAETIAATTPLSEDKAIDEIRNDLLGKIQNASKKIRSSRHFVPLLSALVVMSLFMFLQFNRLIIGQVRTFISPGSITAQNIIVDPINNTKVGQEPRIVIPKINVDAPVVYDVPNLAEATVQHALKSGVIHYPIPGASANPGEKGNAVFLGHSSNDVFDDGDYKFIFVQLEQMQTGDTFYLNYHGTRYTYTVTSTETIMPNQLDRLVTTGDAPTATLVTCTPVGTAQKRFLVHGTQISPDPTGASTGENATPSTSPTPSNISGNSPTLLERLFGF